MKKLLTLVFAFIFSILAGNTLFAAKAKLTVSTSSVDFGEINAGATDTRTFTVSGSSLSDNITISSNNAQLTVSPSTLTRSGSSVSTTTITLSLTPTSAGSGSATVTVSTSGASKTVSVSWTAVVPPPVLTVSPVSVNFGSIDVGDTDTRTITVSGENLTGDVSVSSNNAQLTVSPSGITKSAAESGGQPVTLTLTPTAAVYGSATVTVSSTGASSRTVTVNWNASGGAVPPGAVELPGTVDKSNYSAVSGDMTYYNTDYFDFGPTSAVNTGRWAEWRVYLSHPGRYILTEEYYCSNGHGWQFQLLDDGSNVVSSYSTGNLEGNDGTKVFDTMWDLSSLSPGVYTLRVKNAREWGQPKLRSLSFDYDGEILPDPDPISPWSTPCTTVNYTADNTTVFPNPERGFLFQLEKVVSESSPYCIKGRESYFNASQDDGERADERLVLVLYYLNNYKTTATLPSAVLNAFDEDMQVLRDKGFKCILRYAYDSDRTQPDAAKNIVLGHISQLKSHWAANADVIYVFQAGFIGTWGEWYYTTNFDNENSHMTADRADVVDALLEAVPSDRFVQIRTPLFKTEYLGSSSPLTYSEAYSGTAKARLGHHNDAFLNGTSNNGTYSSPASQKPYLSRETFYVPIGGETNIESESDADIYATYSLTTEEMSYLHWSFCKAGYARETTDKWRANGTFAELNRKMGYRYQLVNGKYSTTAEAGGSLRVDMTITNTGYAPLYNERPVFVVLKNAGSTYRLQMSCDPRRWRPNGETVTVSEELALPAGVEPGTYDLYLWMPDRYENLRSDSRYSVRFANTGVWDSSTGYNTLNASVSVTAAVVADYVVFDNNGGAGDGNWSTSSNWQGGVLPTAGQTARIYTPCTVDITDAVAKAVLITTGTDGVTTYTGHLTIAPTAGLNVVQKIQKAVNADFAEPSAITAADLTIQASSAGQGALVSGGEDGTSGATVQLYSKAYIDAHKHWQYIGIPFCNTPLAQSLFAGGYVYRWDETTASGWNTVTNSTTLLPFAGYCLSQPSAKTYDLTGTLCASSDRVLTVSKTDAGQNGANLFANSWTAPLEIANFRTEDFSNAAIEKTIYIFNTGSKSEYEAIGGESYTGGSPGQYFAVPVNAAPYAAGLPTVIPPMQGFQIMTTAAGTLTLDYARLTAPSDGTHLATQPLKVTGRSARGQDEPDVLRLTVYGLSGESSSDRLYLLKQPECSEAFDNGWDGKKMQGDAGIVSLYSVGVAGELAVDTRNRLEGTDIAFCAGADSHYVLEIYYTGARQLYLLDRTTGLCTQLVDGTTYAFDAEPGEASLRFRIVADGATGMEAVSGDGKNDEWVKELHDGHLFIRNGECIYDASGRRP